MNLEQHNQAIRKVISSATKQALDIVLIGQDNRPEGEYPALEYSTVTITNTVPIGAPRHVQEALEIDANETRIQRVVIQANIDFFGNTCGERAALLPGCVWDSDVIAVMFAEDIGIRKIQEPVNTTALVNGAYEPRYTVKIEFWGEIHQTSTVETIESVGYSVADEDGNELITKDHI